MKRENGNSGMSGEADELMTGAEIVLRALVDQGVDAHLRLSGRRGAADL